MRFGLKTGFLSFDSTRVSANDVGFPIDVVLYKNNCNELIERRFEEHELKEISTIWGNRFTGIIEEIPEEWIDGIRDLPDHNSLISCEQ